MSAMSVRTAFRWLGTGLIVSGVLVLAWVVLVWQWQDPFTALYTKWEQRQLRSEYAHRVAEYRPPRPAVHTKKRDLAAYELSIAAAARRYRHSLHEGDPIGRIKVPRLGLNMIFVNGTDTDTLKKGPARDLQSYLPGEGKLIYIAGHRTTYLAPFGNIDQLRPGDLVTLELPYGVFKYRITGHRIVAADDLSVLKSHGREVVALQACHPRFFATHRYIAYARPVSVKPWDGAPYRYTGTELAALGHHALSN
jgi:sortase A